MPASKGINLGGWLVLEPWMTPGLFKGTSAQDEFSLLNDASPELIERIERHRSTFITENDFQWLAKNGYTTVRIPVGYWALADQPPYLSTKKYLDAAFRWAGRYQIKLLISFHGAQGSQNGNDHSGHAGNILWHKSPDNIKSSTLSLVDLAQRYGSNKQLFGIELLNEPGVAIPNDILTNYYRDAITLIRPLIHKKALIVVHDKFQPLRTIASLYKSNIRGIVIDMHLYQIFGNKDKKRNTRQNIRYAKYIWGPLLYIASRIYPVVVGEWSAALPLERAAPIGRSDYDRYETVQRKVFDRHALAQFYWTYKTQMPNSPWNVRQK